MTSLKTVQGFNTYCGPAVMSALTGESTDRCASVISSISGKKEIRAVEWKHLIQAFHKLRFECQQVMTGSTLFGTIIRLSNEPGFYIVGVPKHVIALEVKHNKEVYFIDNHSREPLRAEMSSRLSQSVDIAYRIIPKDAPKFLSFEIQLKENGKQIDIIRWNKYEKSDDDTTSFLGYLKFNGKEELEQIILTLREKYEL